MRIVDYFHLVDVRARMSLRADASRFMLGYLWWVLEPILFVAVFYLVFEVVLDSHRADFLVFLMCGKLAFIWFAKSVSQASNSIVEAWGLVGKLNTPKSLFPIAVIQEGLYKQSAVFLLLLLVLVAFDYPVTRAWLWLTPVIVVNYLMIVAFSLIGACLVCIRRDFSKFIPLLMTFLLFSSGIFWDVNRLGDIDKTRLVLNYNPVAFIVDAYRQVLMYQNVPDIAHLLSIAVASLSVILVMLFLMRRGSQYLALKVLSG